MTENNDARVTNAVLGVKKVHVKKSLDRLDGTISDAVDEMKDQAKRTTDVEKCIAVLKSDYNNLDDKVDNMDDRYKTINIATSIGAAIAFVLAAFGFRPQ